MRANESWWIQLLGDRLVTSRWWRARNELTFAPPSRALLVDRRTVRLSLLPEQACDERICLRPASVPVVLRVEIKARRKGRIQPQCRQSPDATDATPRTP